MNYFIYILLFLLILFMIIGSILLCSSRDYFSNKDLKIIPIAKDNFHEVEHIIRKNTDTAFSKIYYSLLKMDLDNFKKYSGLIKYNNDFIGVFISQIENNSLYIKHIIINKEYRNRGFGDYIIKHIIKISHDNNIKNITLHVKIKNKYAKKLYRRNGFRIIKRKKKMYNGEGGYMLKKTIT